MRVARLVEVLASNPGAPGSRTASATRPTSRSTAPRRSVAAARRFLRRTPTSSRSRRLRHPGPPRERQERPSSRDPRDVETNGHDYSCPLPYSRAVEDSDPSTELATVNTMPSLSPRHRTISLPRGSLARPPRRASELCQPPGHWDSRSNTSTSLDRPQDRHRK